MYCSGIAEGKGDDNIDYYGKNSSEPQWLGLKIKVKNCLKFFIKHLFDSFANFTSSQYNIYLAFFFVIFFSFLVCLP